MESSRTSQLTFEPIGVARTPFTEKRQAPRQPAAARGVEATLELFPGHGYEDALADLTEWTHLWVLYVFDRAGGWKPKVLPPRSKVKKGVFATRSPHRPNAIGLSVVRLVRVEGLAVHVTDVDLLDGTPILDLKPYVKYTDVVATAGDGWLAPEDPRPAWVVSFGAEAQAALAFLAARGVTLEPEVVAALELGPHPHAYRRIRRTGDEGVLALKEWRVHFRVVTADAAVVVVRIASGYRPRELAERTELGLHREFTEAFRP